MSTRRGTVNSSTSPGQGLAAPADRRAGVVHAPRHAYVDAQELAQSLRALVERVQCRLPPGDLGTPPLGEEQPACRDASLQHITTTGQKHDLAGSERTSLPRHVVELEAQRARGYVPRLVP